jgi:glycine cleavage system H protein
VYAPIAGTVLESNAELAGAPELINQDCYGKGWMIRVQPASTAALEALLSPAAYAAALAAEGG